MLTKQKRKRLRKKQVQNKNIIHATVYTEGGGCWGWELNVAWAWIYSVHVMLVQFSSIRQWLSWRQVYLVRQLAGMLIKQMARKKKLRWVICEFTASVFIEPIYSLTISISLAKLIQPHDQEASDFKLNLGLIEFNQTATWQNLAWVRFLQVRSSWATLGMISPTHNERAMLSLWQIWPTCDFALVSFSLLAFILHIRFPGLDHVHVIFNDPSCNSCILTCPYKLQPEKDASWVPHKIWLWSRFICLMRKLTSFTSFQQRHIIMWHTVAESKALLWDEVNTTSKLFLTLNSSKWLRETQRERERPTLMGLLDRSASGKLVCRFRILLFTGEAWG